MDQYSNPDQTPDQTPADSFTPVTPGMHVPAPDNRSKRQKRKDADAAKKANKQPLTPGQKRIRNYGFTMLGGMALGAIITSGSVPEPEVITETKTVTETVEVEADMPASCQNAYKLAEEVLLRYEDLGPIASDAIDAVNTRNATALDASTVEIDTLNSDVRDGLQGYFIAKFTCEEETGTSLPSVTNAGMD